VIYRGVASDQIHKIPQNQNLVSQNLHSIIGPNCRKLMWECITKSN
jgi:hypothetical protein